MITADTVLIELERLTYREVIKLNNEKIALSCTNALVNCLYLNFKNTLMYIPSTSKEKKQDLQKLHAAIFKQFNGKNQRDLAVKHGRSTQAIYAIIKRELKKHVLKYQSDLFANDIENLEVHEKRPITVYFLEEYLPSEFIRCGLKDDQAKVISNKISDHVCKKFPGVLIYISEDIKNRVTDKKQTSLF